MNELSLALTFKVVDEASRELKRLNTQFSQIKDNWEKVGFAIGASLKVGVTAAIGGIGALTKAAIDNADEMGKMAQKAGVTVEAFSALSYAAKLSDVSNEQLKVGLKGLNEALVDSQDKNSKAAKAFEYLGVATKNADGSLRKADEVFADIAEKFAKMPDGASKTALAMDLMKKSGAEMIPMLNMGKDGLEELRLEAERLGLVISKEQAQQAEQFNDSMTRMGSAASGVGMAIANEVLPTLNALAAQLLDIIKTSPSFKKFGEGVAAVFKFIIKAAAGVIFVFKSIGEGLGALAAAAVAFFSGDFKGAGRIMGEYITNTKEAALHTGEFMDAIDKGVPSMEKSADATEKQNKQTKEYSRATDEAAKATEKRNKAYAELVIELGRQIKGTRQLTTQEQINWELNKGKYADLLPKQKEMVRLKAQEVDQAERERISREQTVRTYFDYKTALDDLVRSGRNTAEVLKVLQRDGSNAAEAFEQQQQFVQNLEGEYRTLQRTLTQVRNTTPNDTKTIRDLELQIAAIEKVQLAFKNNGIQTVLPQVFKLTQDTNQELSAWKKYIGDSRAEMENLNQEEALLWEWLEKNIISVEEFNRVMTDIDEQKWARMRDQLTETEKKMLDMANTVEDTFSSFFYNAMQGQFDNILVSFKQMLDRMVAEALAKNLAEAIFGSNFAKTGSLGGTGGSLISGLFKFFGFREKGGPVTKGQPYIVGEKRAEVFVPQTNGTIIPSVNQAASMMQPQAAQVNLSITAMDSQDVIRALDKIKRPLTELVNGTRRAYNMG